MADRDWTPARESFGWGQGRIREGGFGINAQGMSGGSCAQGDKAGGHRG